MVEISPRSPISPRLQIDAEHSPRGEHSPGGRGGEGGRGGRRLGKPAGVCQPVHVARCGRGTLVGELRGAKRAAAENAAASAAAAAALAEAEKTGAAFKGQGAGRAGCCALKWFMGLGFRVWKISQVHFRFH